MIFILQAAIPHPSPHSSRRLSRRLLKHFLNFIRFLFLRRFLPYALKCPSSIYQSPIVGYIFFSSTSSSDSCEWLNYTVERKLCENIKIERDEKLFYCGIIIFFFTALLILLSQRKWLFQQLYSVVLNANNV